MLGDNKLTAIHMARKCGMIGPTEAVIEVEATPPIGEQQPTINWTPVETHSNHVNNSTKANCRRENGQVRYMLDSLYFCMSTIWEDNYRAIGTKGFTGQKTN